MQELALKVNAESGCSEHSTDPGKKEEADLRIKEVLLSS